VIIEGAREVIVGRRAVNKPALKKFAAIEELEAVVHYLLTHAHAITFLSGGFLGAYPGSEKPLPLLR